MFLSNRALAYCKVGRFQDAAKDALAAVAVDPTYLKGHARLSAAYAGQGRLLSALAACDSGASQADVDGAGDGPEGAFFVKERAKLEQRVRATLAADAAPATARAGEPSPPALALPGLRSRLCKLLNPASRSAMLCARHQAGSRYMTACDADGEYVLAGVESRQSVAMWAPDAAAFLGDVFKGATTSGAVFLAVTVDGGKGRIQTATMTPFPSRDAVAAHFRAFVAKHAVVEVDPTLAATVAGAAWAATPASVATAMGRAGQVAALVLSGAVKTPAGALSQNPRSQAVAALLQAADPAAPVPLYVRTLASVASSVGAIADAVTCDLPPAVLDGTAATPAVAPRMPALPPAVVAASGSSPGTASVPADADSAAVKPAEVVEAPASAPSSETPAPATPADAAPTTTRGRQSITSQPLPPLRPRSLLGAGAGTGAGAGAGAGAGVGGGAAVGAGAGAEDENVFVGDAPDAWGVIQGTLRPWRASGGDGSDATAACTAPGDTFRRLLASSLQLTLWAECQVLQLMRCRNEFADAFATPRWDASLAGVLKLTRLMTAAVRDMAHVHRAVEGGNVFEAVPGPTASARAPPGGSVSP